MSIWTHHLTGISFHDGFTPKECKFKKPIDGAAITVGAGEQMLAIDKQAHLRNLTIISGGAGTVGVGGYLTGGGHAALSSTYGLGADQVLEMDIVTPGGDIITINECQNTDLFWAMRGASTFSFQILLLSNDILGRRLNFRGDHFSDYQSLPLIDLPHGDRICQHSTRKPKLSRPCSLCSRPIPSFGRSRYDGLHLRH